MNRNTLLLPLAFVLICICSNSCQKNNFTKEQLGTATAENLIRLDKNWTLENYYIWKTINGKRKRLTAKDTSKLDSFTITYQYTKNLNTSLAVVKLIDMTGNTNKKLIEQDRYIKYITEDLVSEIAINYHYLTKEHHVFYTAKKASNKKITSNKRYTDSLMQLAEKGQFELCGAHYYSLWEEIPELPIPEVLDTKSALDTLKKWKTP